MATLAEIKAFREREREKTKAARQLIKADNQREIDRFARLPALVNDPLVVHRERDGRYAGPDRAVLCTAGTRTGDSMKPTDEQYRAEAKAQHEDDYGCVAPDAEVDRIDGGAWVAVWILIEDVELIGENK